MILVTGATGNIGRLVVELLLADGEKVEAVTRNPAAAALPGDAHVVSGDPSRPTTLTSLLEGVEAILISPRALGDATAGAATSELLAQAAEQSVERVVALSASDRGVSRRVRAFRGGVQGSRERGQGLRAAVDHSAQQRLCIECPGLGAADPLDRRCARRLRRRGDLDDPRARRRGGRRTRTGEPDTRRTRLPALRPGVTQPTRQGPAHRRSHRGGAVLRGAPSRADPPGHARPGPTRGRPRPVARLAGRLRETAGAVVAHCGDGVGPPRAHLRRVGSRACRRLPELRDGDTRGYRHCPPSPPMTTDNPLELII